MRAAVRKPCEINGWHVLAGFVAFFGLIFAVNGAFMYQAIHTFPGQTVDNPYEAGIEYNRTLARKAAEAELGWSAEVARSGDVVQLIVLDRAGQPVDGLRVVGKLERPATEQGRKLLTLTRTAPGMYEASARGLTGAWDLSATAHDGAGHVFEAHKRLVWP
ncbi:MAG: FixH family protein [Ignavibacteriales bacterium]